MKLESKRMIYLLSELVRPTVAGMDIFKETLKEDYSYDHATGEKIPVFKWTQIVSNGSRKTGNGNLFPKQDTEPAILSPYVQDRIKNNAFYNEFQHPSRSDPERYLQVYDEKVSDKIIRFWFESFNGDDVLMAECETATYAYGNDLRKKIIQGATPAKSLRGAGEVYMDASGRERKNMRIVAYDNVFMPADSFAWGNMNTMQKSQYTESISGMFEKQESGIITQSRKLYIDSVVGIGQHFEEIHQDMTLFKESLGCDVTKIVVDKEKNIIGYYGESATAYTSVGEHLKKAVDDFFKI